MNPTLIAAIAERYGLAVTSFLPVQKGYRNAAYGLKLANGQIANLIVYKREADIVQTIKLANAVGDFAAAAGLPARSTLDPRIIRLQASQTTAYASLYNYLPGQTIAWEAYTHDHLVVTGRGLSDLHASLATFSAGGAHVSDVYQAQLERMERYWQQPNVANAMAAKLGVSCNLSQLYYFKNLLNVCRTLPAQQLHLDFVRSNLLFQSINGKPQLSGMLDFEKTAVGPPLFDIARTLAFLLVDCKYKTAEQVRKGFLLSGYARRGKPPLKLYTLTHQIRQINLLDELVQLFLLHDFYKFLRHNPYESLTQNEHYIRTRDRLMADGIITAVNATIQTT